MNSPLSHRHSMSQWADCFLYQWIHGQFDEWLVGHGPFIPTYSHFEPRHLVRFRNFDILILIWRSYHHQDTNHLCKHTCPPRFLALESLMMPLLSCPRFHILEFHWSKRSHSILDYWDILFRILIYCSSHICQVLMKLWSCMRSNKGHIWWHLVIWLFIWQRSTRQLL